MDPDLARNKELLELIASLEQHEGYKQILLPRFAELAEFHARGCRDRAKTPEKRAEHIEAANEFEALGTYLDTLRSDIKRRLPRK